jgi:hypothetical protein
MRRRLRLAKGTKRQPKGYLATGQKTCHDTSGQEILCTGTGQDAEHNKGDPWPAPRFKRQEETVLDRLTGLVWTENANLAEFPVTWQEALNFVHHMNQEEAFGYADWRLPNRRELRSLISFQTKRPALPEGHVFKNVVLSWYWTSTTASINRAYAWYIHMEGGRMFYGGKAESFLFWPVRRRGYDRLPRTGQMQCFDSGGTSMPCKGSGQDGEYQAGRVWPRQRFESVGDGVVDRLTGLCWSKNADLTDKPVTWEHAFKATKDLRGSSHGVRPWRLPNINELESLVDASMHSPALPAQHPFKNLREAYWSSTTSMFEPDWAWALYLAKGAVGVGQKKGPHFHVWAVCDAIPLE